MKIKEAIDLTLWRTRFARGYGPVLRQSAGCMTQYVCNTRSQLNDCWVLAVYLVVHQVTVHNKCTTCPPPESVYAWTRL